jgi:hypothetical protein
MKFAFGHTDLPVTARIVLVAICHHAGEDGIYRKGHALLAESVRGTQDPAAEKTVQRAIAALAKAGLIERITDPHRGQQPLYKIRFE